MGGWDSGLVILVGGWFLGDDGGVFWVGSV